MIKARTLRPNIDESFRLNPNYKNVMHFKNNNEKEAFFNTIEYGFFNALDATDEINFNIGDTLHTSINLSVDEPLNMALKRNYLIVKETFEDYTYNYYFYFITGVQPIKNNLIKYELELDVFTTYNLKSVKEVEDYENSEDLRNDFAFSSSLIERKHCDRFKHEAGSETIELNLDSEEINKPEDIDNNFIAAIPKKYHELYYDDDDNYEDKSSKNVVRSINGWAVVYVKWNSTDEKISTIQAGNTTIYERAIRFLVPLSDFMLIREEKPEPWADPNVPEYNYYRWNYDDILETFETATNSNIISVQILRYPPFKNFGKYFVPYGLGAAFDRTKYAREHANTDMNGYKLYEFSKPTNEKPGKASLIWLRLNLRSVKKDSENINICEDLEIPKTYNINNLDTFTDLKDIKKEIKILKSPYTLMTVKDGSSKGKEYNILDLKSNTFSVFKYEAPAIEEVKELYGIESGFYSLSKSLSIGVIQSNNYSLPVVDDSYTEFVRSRKNHYLESIGIPAASSAASFLGSVSVLGNPLKIAKKGFNYLAGQAEQTAQYAAHMDDLKNSPDSIRGSMGSYQFILGTNRSVSLYVEYDSLTDEDKNNLFEYFFRFGYQVNKYLESGELFGRTRFNFIKTGEEITDKILCNEMSPLVKKKISDALLNGVRFWEKKSIFPNEIGDYSLENYEKIIFE